MNYDITNLLSTTCYILPKQAYKEIGNSGNENAKQKLSNHYVEIKPSLSGNLLIRPPLYKDHSIITV